MASMIVGRMFALQAREVAQLILDRGQLVAQRERKEIFSRAYGRHEGEPQEKEIELRDVSLEDLVKAL